MLGRNFLACTSAEKKARLASLQEALTALDGSIDRVVAMEELLAEFTPTVIVSAETLSRVEEALVEIVATSTVAPAYFVELLNAALADAEAGALPNPEPEA